MDNANRRLLLIYPRYQYVMASSLEEPLGLVYVATAARRAGWDPRVLDLTFDKDLSRVETELRGNPFAVGMSVTSPLLDKAVEVLQFIKERNPSLPVAMGGPHPSAFPENALESGFDYAVMGDGEEAFTSLLDAIRTDDWSDVHGLAFQGSDGTIQKRPPRFAQDLDAIAFPDRSYLDYSRYEKAGLIATRGCPYNCFYCKPMQDKLFGRKIRRRTPENVVDEVEQVIDRLGQRILHFRDDTITIGGLDWFTRFRDRLRERIPGGVRYQCNSRVDQINEEKIRLMKESGCYQIFFGVESGSQKILDFYQKGTTPEQAVEAFRLCKEFKIQAVAAIMLGAPSETREDLELTYKLVKRIKPDNWIVFTTTPFPGNYLYDYAKENNLIRVSKSEQFDNAMNKRLGFMPLELKHLTSKDLRKYTAKIDRYMLFHSLLNPRTLLTAVRRPRSAYIKIANLLRFGNRLKRKANVPA